MHNILCIYLYQGIKTVSAISMKKPNKILQSHFSVDLPETIDNYLVLTFTEDDKTVSTHFVRFPDSWVFYDKRYRYYIFSLN